MEMPNLSAKERQGSKVKRLSAGNKVLPPKITAQKKITARLNKPTITSGVRSLLLSNRLIIAPFTFVTTLHGAKRLYYGGDKRSTS
jgi:hypothetical protein